LYRTGNKVLLGIIAWNIVLIALIKIYYMKRNEARETTWSGMTQEEKDHYLANTRDRGNKRYAFLLEWEWKKC
jgi:hypothetical protein